MQRLRSFLIVAALSTAFACTEGISGPQPDAAPTHEPTVVSGNDAPAKPVGDPLPDGANLLAEHVEASGGAAAIAKFESIHVKGTLSVEAHNLHGTTELWWTKDGHVYLEQDIEGIGKSRVGYDGETIWVEDPITGLRKLDGSEAAGYKQSALMFLGADWREHFSAANTIAQLERDGAKIYEVELVSKGGPNLTLGIDAKTKLITYVKSIQPSMLGDTPIEIRNDSYKAIEGYQFSMHRINAISTLLELDETITKFEVNVPIDPAMFGFPSKREVVPLDPTKQPAIEAPKPKG